MQNAMHRREGEESCWNDPLPDRTTQKEPHPNDPFLGDWVWSKWALGSVRRRIITMDFV